MIPWNKQTARNALLAIATPFAVVGALWFLGVI